MIGSRTGVIVLAVIAAVLAAIVALDRPAPPVDHALSTGDISELRFERAKLSHDAKGWTWDAGGLLGRADAATVDAVLSALRGGRWHRRAPAERAGATHGRVEVVAGGKATTFAIGAELSSEQTWIVRGDEALLVDRWIADALSPSSLALRDRHVLRGSPIAHHQVRGMWVDPGIEAEVIAAREALEIVALPDGPAHANPGTALDVADLHHPAEGRCEAVYLTGAFGDGCFDTARWERLVAALKRLDGNDIADRRPLPIDPVKLVLPDGAVIERGGHPRIDGEDADTEAVDGLVMMLRTPARVVSIPDGPRKATLVATARDGTAVTLDLYDHALVRRGERVALAPELAAVVPELWESLAAGKAAYRDRTRWLEEPTTITMLIVDGKAYQRGVVIGEWQHAKNPSAVEGYVDQLAALVAPAAPRRPTHPLHLVEIVVQPPVGESRRHSLQLHADCQAIADDVPVSLDAPTCGALSKLP